MHLAKWAADFFLSSLLDYILVQAKEDVAEVFFLLVLLLDHPPSQLGATSDFVIPIQLLFIFEPT